MKNIANLFTRSAKSATLVSGLALGLLLSACGDGNEKLATEKKLGTPPVSLAAHTAADNAKLGHLIDAAVAETRWEEAAPITDSIGTAEPESLSATQGLSVLKAVACTSISGHEPVGTSTTFDKEVGKVWVYSKVQMPKGTSGIIQHVYKRNGKHVGTVDLAVIGPTFRTRSYKTITDKLLGEYTVEVVTESGAVLDTVSFSVE